jgi:hypothetical protein
MLTMSKDGGPHSENIPTTKVLIQIGHVCRDSSSSPTGVIVGRMGRIGRKFEEGVLRSGQEAEALF